MVTLHDLQPLIRGKKGPAPFWRNIFAEKKIWFRFRDSQTISNSSSTYLDAKISRSISRPWNWSHVYLEKYEESHTYTPCTVQLRGHLQLYIAVSQNSSHTILRHLFCTVNKKGLNQRWIISQKRPILWYDMIFMERIFISYHRISL